MSDWPVPMISQRSMYLCWEACGHMLWNWRHGEDAEAHKKKAGVFANKDEGLVAKDMDIFYKLLGLRSLPNPEGKNVRFALKWGPVIVTSEAKKVTGHAMVVVGHFHGDYRIIDPCGKESVQLGESDAVSCEVGKTHKPQTDVDRELGKLIWYW